MTHAYRRFVAAVVICASMLPVTTRAADVSPPVILQYFESQWTTMEKRVPDIFMAGYGGLWTPPPGRALYDDQGGGIGYNLYDRFDLGKAGDRTAFGTEKGYRTLVKQMHQMNGDVYVDYVHHHVGSWDIPAYNGWGGYTPESWQHVQDRSDYPGFELSDQYVGANSFNPNYRNLAGHRDSYPDAPPVNDGNTSQYQYQYRLAHLITIDLTSNRAFVRNPIPGDPNNIRQAPNAYALATSTLLPNGKVGAATIVRQANTPTEDNRRFYPDNSLPGITVTDPKDGNQSFTIHPYNTANPSAGDPVAETPRGYMMRYAQWLINDIGVDGLRIDAARHVPYGVDGDAYNPQDLDIPSLIDRAVYRQNTRTNLDGTQRTVFNFQEVFSGDKNLLQAFTRKDINPGTPNVVGGNRDVLDFPMWFAMRGNLTNNGLTNNWYNIRFASQDINDDGLANNGSQSIGFVINHDDGKGPGGSDFIHLDNVAHAWILTRPGNAYVYFNSHEFDRTGNNEYFLKDGRGDALGGQYGNIVTKLLDIRNSYGRGNFQERWIDGGGFSNVYAYERQGSMIVGLNSALGTVTNYDSRTMNTAFAVGTHLEEQTGNALNPQVDPLGEIPDVITVGAGGVITMRIPRNQNTSGVEHGKGYVIYGLPRPLGQVSLSNVSQTLGSELPGSNATARITSVDVITGNSFNVTLDTNKRILSDAFHDIHADGDSAYLRIDGGLNLNGNAGVDFITQGDTRYGFENFLTLNDPGYDANPAISGNGQFVQTINAAALSEGYHYLTARAYRHKSMAGEQDVFNDFKKVIYVDRLPPMTVIDGVSQSGSGGSKAITVAARSLDLTADNVHLIMDLGAAVTDSQILAMLNSGTQTAQTDRDLFSKSANVITGTHVATVVTREITGNYSIVRATGLGVTGGLGLGFGDLDFNGVVNSSDISSFQSVLQSNNQTYHSAAEANTDGLINLSDTFLLGPRLTAVGANGATVTAYNNMINTAYVTSGTYDVDADHVVYDVTAGATHVLTGRTLTARSIRGNSLTLDHNAHVNMTTKASGASTSKLTSLSFASTASLDIKDNALIVTGMNYNAVEALVKQGFGNFDWLGNGITSSTAATFAQVDGSRAVGVIDNADWGYGTFGGLSVNGTDILVKYTWVADANLDGLVDNDDFGQFLYGFNGGGSARWLNGDFDFSGVVDNDDFGWFLTGLGAFNASGNMQLSESFKAELSTFATANGIPLVVPEPASALFLIAGISLARRTHRRLRLSAAPAKR